VLRPQSKRVLETKRAMCSVFFVKQRSNTTLLCRLDCNGTLGEYIHRNLMSNRKDTGMWE